MGRSSLEFGRDNKSFNVFAFSENGAGVLSPAVPQTGEEFALVSLGGYGLPRKYGWMVDWGTPANVLSSTILLEGTLNGTNWFTLDTYSGVADAIRHVVDKPVVYIRVRVTALDLTLSTSTTLTVSIVAGR